MTIDTEKYNEVREWVAGVLALVVIAVAAGGIAQMAAHAGLAATAMGDEEFRSVDALGSDLPLTQAEAQHVATMLDLKRPPTHERVEVTTRGGSGIESTDSTTLTTYLESYAGGRKLRVLGSKRVDDFRFTAVSSSRDSIVMTVWSRGDTSRGYHGQIAYYDRNNPARPLIARSWYHDTGRATLRAHLSPGAVVAGQTGFETIGDADALVIAQTLLQLTKNRSGDTDFAIDSYRVDGGQPRFRLISQQGMVYEVIGGVPRVPVATVGELEALGTNPLDEGGAVRAVLAVEPALLHRVRATGNYETYGAFAGVVYRASTSWDQSSYYETKGSNLTLRGRRSILSLTREDARIEQEYWFSRDGRRVLRIVAEYPPAVSASALPTRLTIGTDDGGSSEIYVVPGALRSEQVEQLRRDYAHVIAIVAARAKIRSQNPLELTRLVRDPQPAYTLVDTVSGTQYLCTHPKGLQAPASCVGG